MLPAGMVAPSSAPAPAPDHRAAVAAGFLGWTLDAFDFFLVVMTLTAIARDFHRSDAAVALSITLTLAFRPVGAFVFGLLADRYGRRIPLMADLIFYSVVEVLTGLAPTFTSFLVLRALVRHRDGRRVGRRCVAGDGEGADPAARSLLGVPAAGLRGRLPARGAVLLRRVPALGVAPPVLHRRAAGAAGGVHPLPGEGVGGVAALAGAHLERARAGHRAALAAVPVPRGC